MLTLVAVMAHVLRLKLRDGSTEQVQVRDGASADAELEAFVGRKGRFRGEWIEVFSVDGEGRKYVRYDEIVSVDLFEPRRPSGTAW